jgi:hypothetical protein
MTADRADRLARLVEQMGADLTLSPTTRHARLQRVEDHWRRELSGCSLSAVSRELRRRRTRAGVADGLPPADLARAAAVAGSVAGDPTTAHRMAGGA